MGGTREILIILNLTEEKGKRLFGEWKKNARQ
jgi:hypothetical protein